MQLQNFIPLLAVFGSALAIPATPKERSPATGTVIETAKVYCPKMPANPLQQKVIFKKFIDKMYADKQVIEAFNTHVAVDLIEHGPYDPQGRDAVAAKLAPIFTNGNYEILRWNYDNSYGSIMLKVNLPDGTQLALIDLFRMDGTCIVEHWDISQLKPLDATNPLAMF